MEIQTGERLAEVTLLSKDGNAVSIGIDGKVYNVDVCMLAGGRCSIIHDGVSYNPRISHMEGSRHYRVELNYSSYEMDMLDSQARYMRLHRKALTRKDADRVVAPMPSKVTRIFVESGQLLKAGDPVLTMEAMKMQSTVTAPGDCRVVDVKCLEGDSVAAEQTLVTLDFERL